MMQILFLSVILSLMFYLGEESGFFVTFHWILPATGDAIAAKGTLRMTK